jgi:hypothetical protein
MTYTNKLEKATTKQWTFRSTPVIIFMALFTVVLFLSGSCLVNLYNCVSDGKTTPSNVKETSSFHNIIGITTLCVGGICLLFTAYCVYYSEEGVKARKYASTHFQSPIKPSPRIVQ